MLLNIVFNGFTISFLGSRYNTHNKYTITDQSMQKYPLVGYYKKSIKECILNDIAHNSGWNWMYLCIVILMLVDSIFTFLLLIKTQTRALINTTISSFIFNSCIFE